MNVYLIGYRCTGKTTVGQRLARRLGLRFVDGDRELVREEGRSIDDVVREHGWPHFRRLEKERLRQWCRTDGLAVATGGGVVLDPGNVSAMQRTGTVVWLRAAPATVRLRMAADPATGTQRPGLTQAGALAEIEEVMTRREPLYRGAARLRIDTDGKDVAAVCTEIIQKLEGLTHVEHTGHAV